MAWFNLIVSHVPGWDMKRRALDELRRVLGWDMDVVERQPNLIFLRVPDADRAVEKLRSELPEDTVILRVVPVYRVVDPNLDAVKSVVKDLLLMAPDGSFAVKVDGYIVDGEGRRMSRMDAAARIADGIDRPVNLDNPDVLVYVKVVRVRGRYRAAVYVGAPRGILSIVKERR